MIGVLLTSTRLRSAATAAYVRFFSSPRPPRRIRKKLQRLRAPPPPSLTDLDAAISSLPARFTSDDLASAISSLPDPRLCPHLLSWASSLPSPRSRPSSSAFLAALRRLGAARLYPELSSASSLALSLLPSPPESLSNTIIYFFAEARKLSAAVAVYKRMRESPNPDSRPTIRTYNILFAALLGRGANSYVHHYYMSTLRSLFRQMHEAGVEPDIFALNSMIKGYVQSLHLNDALRIFHQMEPVYKISPNEYSYNYLIHGLCAQGRTRNAKQVFDEMCKRGMVTGARACNSLVSAMAMEGELEEAVELLREMGKNMGRFADCITCRAVLEGVCERWSARDAVNLLHDLRDDKLVDGQLFQELMHWLEDEYGGSGSCNSVRGRGSDGIPVPLQVK